MITWILQERPNTFPEGHGQAMFSTQPGRPSKRKPGWSGSGFVVFLRLFFTNPGGQMEKGWSNDSNEKW